MVPVTKWHSANGHHSTIRLPNVSDNRMPTVLFLGSPIFNPNLLGLADSKFRDSRIQDERWEHFFSFERREDVERSVLAGGHQEVGPVGDSADRRREQALPARAAMQGALNLL